MSKFIMEIPDDLKIDLKHYAIDCNMSMSKLIIKLIHEELVKGGYYDDNN